MNKPCLQMNKLRNENTHVNCQVSNLRRRWWYKLIRERERTRDRSLEEKDLELFTLTLIKKKPPHTHRDYHLSKCK